MPYVEEVVTTTDGSRLYARRREAESPKAEVTIVHGFGEHSGRYAAITDHLVSAGYSVTAYDHRGHGQSDGLPGHVEKFRDYEDDLDRVITWVHGQNPTASPFLIGHSMGGLIALRYLSQNERERVRRIAGAVVSAPLIGVAAPVPQHKLMIGRVAAKLAPRMRLDNEIDPAVLSRDPEVGVAYAADPLVNRRVSARWFAEATLAMQEVIASAGRITTPLLVMHGTEDKLASFEATQSLFPMLGSKDKEFAAYPGFYHELFNEPEKQELFSRVSSWLDQRL